MGDLQESYDGEFIRKLRQVGLTAPIMDLMRKLETGEAKNLRGNRKPTDAEKRKGYATRFPPEGSGQQPTAIDWIFVDSDLAPCVISTGIQEAEARARIGSDHALVFLHLQIPFTVNQANETRHERIDYKAISKIKIKEKEKRTTEKNKKEKEIDIEDQLTNSRFMVQFKILQLTLVQRYTPNPNRASARLSTPKPPATSTARRSTPSHSFRRWSMHHDKRSWISPTSSTRKHALNPKRNSGVPQRKRLRSSSQTSRIPE
jgi:hypothetical protein